MGKQCNVCENKTCTACQINKPLIDFVKSNQHKDGRSSWCKKCNAEYRRNNGLNSYSLRAEYLSNYQKKLRKTAKNKKYEEEFRKKYKSTFSGVSSKLLSGARSRAKLNGLEIDIDKKWVMDHILPLKCEATGVDLNLLTDHNVMHTPFKPSIDRIDNDKGYLKNNCRIVAVIYNKAKSDCKDEDVFKMAESLVKFKRKKK